MDASFVRGLQATAARFPEKPVLLAERAALTWRELDLRAGGLARALAAGGVGPGDKIALGIPNRPAFVVALLAGWTLGATVAPLDTLLKEDERREILRDLGPAMVLTAEDIAGVEAAPEVGAGAGPVRVSSRAAGPAPVPTSDSGSAPALVLYTSGSTGRPKGAVLSHSAVAFANASWAGPVMGLGPDDTVLAALPCVHSFGLNGALLAPLLAGASVVLVERFSPEAVLRAIAQYRVTVFPGVATMFRRILDVPGLAHADLSSLRLAVSGAAPCPWELAEEWRRRTGTRILRGYGMTELFRPISYLAHESADHPDAVGRPVPGVEVRVVDEAGRPLAPGEVGELWVRTPAAMSGYLNAPDETAAVLRDGWFRTGDLAASSPAGFVRIAGRKRERILRGGYSIFPQEVEAVLLTHPAVAEAAVLGVAHPELGEEVVAFVALRPGARAEPEELVAYCRDRLAAFKYPRRVTIVERLPRGRTGKVTKSGLAES